MARIGIVGCGIVGLACAHALAANGHAVTLIDRDPDGDKCSWGNAGGIAAPEVLPAAVPGIIRRVPRWLIDPLGPLALRPTHLPRALPWLRHFVAAARPERMERAAAALAVLNRHVTADMEALLAAVGLRADLRRTGALSVYETAAALAADRPFWALAARLGFPAEEVSSADARALEPALGPRVACGVLDPGWSQVSDPKRIWRGLFDSLIARGVPVIRAEMRDFDTAGLFDQIVVAAGAWSAALATRFGDRVLLESERGYNTTLPAPGIALSREVIFAERKFVATPLSIGLRIGGAAEFAGLAAPPNFARSRALLRLARLYLPDLDAGGGSVWMGHRPSTPDSLPVIGRSPHRPAVIYAFGHGHLGLTQSATTARLVAALAAGRDPGIDLAPYAINRFARSMRPAPSRR